MNPLPPFLRAAAHAPEPAASADHAPPARVPAAVETRYLAWSDMPGVLAIERASFGANAFSELTLRRVLDLPNVVGMAAVAAGQGPLGDVRGFAIFEFADRRLQVIHLAVAPAHRRRGVGRALADRLKSHLCPRRRPRIELFARETALPAHLFWAAQGFRAVGVVRGHFPDTHEDAYAFRYRIAASGRGPWESPCPPAGEERG